MSSSTKDGGRGRRGRGLADPIECIQVMVDSRCPEPKPIAILLLGLAGALAGALDGIISEPTIQGMFSHGGFTTTRNGVFAWAPFGAMLGAGIGVGIGVSVSISRRAWIRLPLGLVFGSMGAAAPFLPSTAFAADPGRSLGLFIVGLLALWLGAPAGILLTLAHHRYCKHRGHLRALVWYSLLGIVSGCVFWCFFSIESGGKRYPESPIQNLPAGIATGLVFGLTQFLGMFLAMAWHQSQPRPMGLGFTEEG